jgi:hypothetical protein
VVATVRAGASEGDGIWSSVEPEVVRPQSRRLLAAPFVATVAAAVAAL